MQREVLPNRLFTNKGSCARLKPLDLAEHQRVHLTLEEEPARLELGIARAHERAARRAAVARQGIRCICGRMGGGGW